MHAPGSELQRVLNAKQLKRAFNPDFSNNILIDNANNNADLLRNTNLTHCRSSQQ